MKYWEALVRYPDDGRLEIDNNAAEGALRAVALGRKDYLFAGSDAGGERAAAIYSPVGTAKLNSLDPETTCATCSHASPTIPSTASRACCRGMSSHSVLTAVATRVNTPGVFQVSTKI